MSRPRARALLAGSLCLFSIAARAQVAPLEAPVAVPGPLPLDWCVERALEANPDLASEAAASDAARHRILPAGALEDPAFAYEASNLPIEELDFDSTPMSGQELRVSQRLPFPGVLSNRADAARAGAESAEATLAERRVRVAAAVERVWAELGFAQRALEITDRNIDLVRQLARVADAKYGVGRGLQQDVLRAQVELTQLLDQRLRREAAVGVAEASLAALLDLPPETPLPSTGDLADVSTIPDLAPLADRIEQVSPRLRALAARIAEAERLRRVTELEGYPDFDLGLGYRIRESVSGDPVRGQDFVGVALTLRLPVNRAKWRERLAERSALLRRAEADYRSGRAALREALRAAHAELSRSDAAVALLETGLVPQARQSLESSRPGYEVDKVDFLSLLDSQVRFFDAELRLVRARADRRAAFAALEATFGEPLR